MRKVALSSSLPSGWRVVLQTEDVYRCVSLPLFTEYESTWGIDVEDTVVWDDVHYGVWLISPEPQVRMTVFFAAAGDSPLRASVSLEQNPTLMANISITTKRSAIGYTLCKAAGSLSSPLASHV